MLDVQAIKPQDLKALSTAGLATLATQMLAHIGEQSRHIGEQDKRIDSQAQAIKWRDAKIENITFQLARLKDWKFGAKTERMNAEQRDIFEETLAADQASLEAQLEALQGAPTAHTPGVGAPDKQPRRQPKREALPAHLPRVDQRIEPEDTCCPTPECGQPMVRVGEDISERLDIVPAQFFVQRQIRGKWACKRCQLLVQEPAAPQVFDNALPTPGLQANAAVSRLVDHISNYRQEQINARSGVRTPRSTLAAWGGQTGVQLVPLFDAHRAFVLGSRVVHADETPIALLDPGGGKTKKSNMWAYARGVFEPDPGAKDSARLSTAATLPPMLKQCATTAITAVRAASTMLAMGAMLGRLVVQLKMPRLDAYAGPPPGACAEGSKVRSAATRSGRWMTLKGRPAPVGGGISTP
jgi:transposase